MAADGRTTDYLRGNLVALQDRSSWDAFRHPVVWPADAKARVGTVREDLRVPA